MEKQCLQEIVQQLKKCSADQLIDVAKIIFDELPPNLAKLEELLEKV